jgi:hypothetical protein
MELEVEAMRHMISPQVQVLEKFVNDFYRQHPTYTQAIDAVLRPFRLPDGSLQNDDNIMHGLRELAKGLKRKPRLPGRSWHR